METDLEDKQNSTWLEITHGLLAGGVLVFGCVSLTYLFKMV